MKSANEGGAEDDYCLMDETMNSPKPSMDRHNSILTDNVVVRKGLLTLNELNEKFMRSNSYYIFLAVFLYITLGVAVYHHWLEWDQLDSLYFIVSTCSTVGYGDFVPETHNEKMFTSFYIIVGIAICGMLVSIVTTFLFDHQERMNKQRSMRAFVMMKEQKNAPSHPNPTPNHSRYGQSIDSVQSGATEGTGGVVKFKRNRSFFDYAYSFRPSMERIEKTFEEIREESISSYREDLIKYRWSIFYHVIGIFVFLMVGMLVMMAIEKWVAVDAFYWATISLTTVGYGDISPKSKGGIVFTIFYVIIGCGYMAVALTEFVKYPLLSRMLKNEIKIVNQFSGDMTPEKLEAIFHSDFYKLIPDLKRNEHELSKCEFVLMVLQLMNKVEEKDIFLVAKLFENLDTDRKGFLSDEEMSQQLTAARESMHQRESLGRRPESVESSGSGPFNVQSGGHLWKKRTDSTQSPGAPNQRKRSSGTPSASGSLKQQTSASASASAPSNASSSLKRSSDPTVNALLLATTGQTSLARTMSGGNIAGTGGNRIFSNEEPVDNAGDDEGPGGAAEDDHI